MSHKATVLELLTGAPVKRLAAQPGQANRASRPARLQSP